MPPAITNSRILQTLSVLCLSVTLSAEVYATPKAKEATPRVTGERQFPQIRSKHGPRGRKDKEIDFQYRGINHRMVLTPSSVRSDTFKVTAIGEGGTRKTVAVEPPALYKGFLADNPDAKVAVTLQGKRIHGYVKMPDGTVIGIQPETGDDQPVHSVYAGDDIDEPEVSCAVQDPIVSAATDSDSSSDPSPTIQALTASSDLYIAEIAFEADYEFYVKNGSSVSATVADIESILNGINTIYENDVQIRYVISEVLVEESTSIYTNTVASNLLFEVQDNWNQNYNSGAGSISRDIMHLMTGKSMVGNTIGIAFTGIFCSFPTASYGLSESRFSTTYARRVAVTAHELGHNWNALHCSCNIMCSSVGGCGGTLTQFSQTSIDAIVSWRDAHSNCLDLVSRIPSALDDTYAVTPNASTNLNVLANDSDIDNEPLQIVSITAPLHGTASITPDQTIHYHSDEFYQGSDQFSYVITDHIDGNSTGQVYLGVGTGIEYEYYEGNFRNMPTFDTLVPVTTGITENVDLSKAEQNTSIGLRFRTQLDVPTSDTYTFFLVGNDRANLLIDNSPVLTTGNGSSSEYPTSLPLTQGLHDFEVEYSEYDFFRITAALSISWSSSTITKQAIPDSNFVLSTPNLSPVAVDDTAYTTENSPVTVRVLTNDFDPDGISVSLSTNTTPAGGSATINASGILYTPSSNYFGTEQIVYTISDTQGATDSATLEILVDTDTDLDSLFNAVDPDDDNDGLSDEEEAIAGTSSTNKQSFFMADMESGPAVTFVGVSGRLYQLQVKTNLTDTLWFNVGSEINGQGIPIQIPTTNSNDAAYYRVAVRLAP